MNLAKLFEMQRQLDEHIEKEHPQQEGEDRLSKKILALQVELGELCNCWSGFKYWSYDQEPGIIEYCSSCGGRGVIEYFDPFDEQGYMQDPCDDCEGNGTTGRIPLLEEFADCLHFILSIGLELNFTDIDVWKVKETTTTNQFIECFGTIYNIHFQKTISGEVTIEMYEYLFARFIGLGEMLGFTWEQVEEAYMQKNVENLDRQRYDY